MPAHRSDAGDLAAGASPEGLIEAIRARGVRDRRVVAAFCAVRRAGFVPPEAASVAYVDEPVRIPHGQVPPSRA